jgi:hypothetical protein
MEELKNRLGNLKADLTFVRHSGALKEVEDYLENEINTVNGALVACSAYDRASQGYEFSQIEMVL